MISDPTEPESAGTDPDEVTGDADGSDPQQSVAQRLGRLEETLADLSDAVTVDREALQAELHAVTEALVGGDDSTGITSTAEGVEQEDPEEGVGFTGWADRADDEDWAGLIQWVDWLSTTYALGDLAVRPCWPAHGAAIEELGALKMAWEQAIGACMESEWVGTEALAYWHDRYLPGTVQRLQMVHGMKVCKSRHEQRPRPVLTDTSHVVIGSTGEVPDLAVSSL